MSCRTWLTRRLSRLDWTLPRIGDVPDATADNSFLFFPRSLITPLVTVAFAGFAETLSASSFEKCAWNDIKKNIDRECRSKWVDACVYGRTQRRRSKLRTFFVDQHARARCGKEKEKEGRWKSKRVGQLVKWSLAYTAPFSFRKKAELPNRLNVVALKEENCSHWDLCGRIRQEEGRKDAIF